MEITKNCEYCGAEFKCREGHKTLRKYCSNRCNRKNCTSKKLSILTCAFCKKEFQDYVRKGYPRIFCSIACRNSTRRKFNYEALVTDYKNKMSWADLMSKHKISRSRLGNILNELNISHHRKTWNWNKKKTAITDGQSSLAKV